MQYGMAKGGNDQELIKTANGKPYGTPLQGTRIKPPHSEMASYRNM